MKKTKSSQKPKKSELSKSELLSEFLSIETYAPKDERYEFRINKNFKALVKKAAKKANMKPQQYIRLALIEKITK